MRRIPGVPDICILLLLTVTGCEKLVETPIDPPVRTNPHDPIAANWVPPKPMITGISMDLPTRRMVYWQSYTDSASGFSLERRDRYGVAFHEIVWVAGSGRQLSTTDVTANSRGLYAYRICLWARGRVMAVSDEVFSP
jgi:hypothetical protein